MLSLFAELQREPIVANTNDGLASARARDMFGVPRSTMYGHLDKTKTVPRQPKKTTAMKP
ncbi:hypothetical protein ACFV2X_27920 [Streptomyces sp. NPDC059679]|uniref:hypothetical protein n=1 Tax=Streptomyces sp. NPDC059679 TaxID=3346903 RepID=UPI00369D6F85